MNEETTDMPLLVIEAEGKIIASNFAEFDAAARQWLAEINRDLRTDEEFDQAAEDVKKAKQVEELLAATRDAVLEKAETLNAELTRLSGLGSAMRDARLELSRQIEKAKTDQRDRLIEASLGMLECDKSMREGFRSEIENACKGKKSILTMRDAARIAIKVCNDRIGRSKRLLDEFTSEHGPALLPDRRNLEATDPVALAAEIRRRIEASASQAEAKKLREAASLAQQESAAARREAELAKGREEVAKLAATTPPPRADDAPWLADPDTPGPGSSVGLTPSEPEPEPAGGGAPDEATELASLLATVVAAFKTVKQARAALIHPANKAIALELATFANGWYSKYSK